jgi:hypothetical protein
MLSSRTSPNRVAWGLPGNKYKTHLPLPTTLSSFFLQQEQFGKKNRHVRFQMGLCAVNIHLDVLLGNLARIFSCSKIEISKPL